MFDEIKAVCRRHYEDKLLQYGDSPQGVNWADADSQRLRFQVLSEVGNLNGKKIYDVGCGLGHLVEFLAERGVNCEYVGSDISPQMIQKAKQRLPQAQLYVADILNNVTPDWMRADYLFASGVFYVKATNDHHAWQKFVEAMLLRMFDLAERAIAFNMLTSYVDYKDSNLFYLSPADTLDFCIRNLGRRIVIRHDYPLWEYTVYVYKKVEGT
jgi:SAM-dependent methyltransferase